ncbi:hypothetical protein AB5N19_07745 [Seiridium cardinale]|uniref:Uncharacterized protein n=1 Tax=Seiridium cardinale TaxID=138064 RepID=A0ABR2X8Z6_9PEZI
MGIRTELASKFIPEFLPDEIKTIIKNNLQDVDPRTNVSHGQVYDYWRKLAAGNEEDFKRTAWITIIILCCSELGLIPQTIWDRLADADCLFFVREFQICRENVKDRTIINEWSEQTQHEEKSSDKAWCI